MKFRYIRIVLLALTGTLVAVLTLYSQRAKPNYDSIIIEKTQKIRLIGNKNNHNNNTDSIKYSLYKDLSFAYFRIDATLRNIDSSLFYNQLQIKIATRIYSPNHVMDGLNFRAMIYYDEGLHSKMFEVTQEMKRFCEATPNCNRIDLYHLREAALFKSLGDTDKAIYHYQICIEKTKDNVSQMDCNLLLGDLYLDKGQSDKAVTYLSNGFEIAKKIQNRGGKVVGANTLGYAYLELGEAIKAKHFAEEALLYNTFPSKIYFGTTYTLLAKIALKEEDYEEAINYSMRAIAMYNSIPNPSSYDYYQAISKNYDFLYQAYKRLNKVQEALDAFEKLSKVKDEIENLNRNNEHNALQRKFEIERIEIENERQKIEQKNNYELLLRNLQIKQLKQLAQKKELQNQLLIQKLESEKQTKTNEQILTKTQQINLVRDKQIKQLLIDDLNKKLQLESQKIGFRKIAISLLLVALLGILFGINRYFSQKRVLMIKEAERLQKEAEFQQEVAIFQQRISETEMAALRSQMNPHFIFNCLNSIKSYSLNNDNEKVSLYLTKFSRLIRLVLENSKSEKITLKNELETLLLYMEMEKLRFGEKFDFEIKVAREVEEDFIEIPPMLIQPYIENAIWHGLMHKKGGGQVMILVNHPQERLLQFVIEDNGIGRQKSTEIKNKNSTQHKSFGMKITSERLDIIRRLYNINATVIIEDLTNPIGTRVRVDIPI